MATDALTISELFEVHGANELRRRVVNNERAVGRLRTFLFCRTFAWTINNVRPGHNAVDRRGVRYHIRCQLATSGPMWTIEMSDSPPFDSLAVALMDNNLKVVRAYDDPHRSLARKSGARRAHGHLEASARGRHLDGVGGARREARNKTYRGRPLVAPSGEAERSCDAVRRTTSTKLLRDR